MCLIENKNGQKYSMYDIKVLITFDNEQKKWKKSFFIYILEKLKLLILLAPWQGKRNWFVLTRLLSLVPKISKTLRICRTMVFCYKNCSELLWEKNVLVIKKNFWNSRLKAKNLQIFEITRTIHSNSDGSEQFLVTECFFNLFLKVSHV